MTDRREAGEHALAKLLTGNAAYRNAEQNPAKLTDLIRLQTAEQGQHPYAAVVCCADSRVPAEHVFGAGIGELFVIRNAGNVISPSALASVEYAVGHLHVPLVLVMGHRGCGAVAAALSDHPEPGALGALVAQVREIIGAAASPAEAELANVKSAVRTLRADPTLQEAAIVGALYDIRTGEVTRISDD